MKDFVLHYLLITIIVTFAVPVVGLILDEVIDFLYGIVAGILGNAVTFFLFNIVTFVGTMHHELSHALLAFITGAKVEKVVLFHPEGLRLGYVVSRPRGNRIMQAIQETYTGIAPVLCGGLSIAGLSYLLYKVPMENWLRGIVIYVIISIFLHMTMSLSDFITMLKGIWIVFLVNLVLCFGYGFVVSAF